MSDIETKTLKGVEIFSTGVWNHDDYDSADLDDMVKAFHENSPGVRPHLKLGHSDNQKLIQNDGLPAAGWVSTIYRAGDKLLADFVDIPKKIFDLIERKAYRKVSCEIYWNIHIGDKLYRRMLGAVALLGADMPGVMNLNDILGLYGLKDYESIKSYASKQNEFTIKQYSQNDRGELMSKSENEIKLEFEAKDYAKKVSDLEVELKALKEKEESNKSKEEELSTLREYKKTNETELALAKDKLLKAEIDGFITQLATDKLITPAMKPYVKALVESIGLEAREFSVKVNKEDKKFDTKELFKQILKLHTATDVNLSESSEVGDEAGNKEGAQEAKIQDYMAQNKCDYATAYKAVLRKK